MNRATGFIHLVRPINSLMMGLAVTIGEVITLRGGTLTIHEAALGFATGFTLTAASMTINDYYDRTIDTINDPTRPIPSGLISPREAITFATILSLIGLTTAALTNFLCLIIASFSLTISMIYNTIGKQTGLLGNFMVSCCVAIPFVYGSFAVKVGLDQLTLIFAMLAFLSNTGREITKGIADIEGDKTRNIRTIAIIFGPKAAAAMAIIFYISAVILSAIPWFYGYVSSTYLPFVAITDAGFIVSSISLLNNHSRENAKRIKKMVLIWMMVGLLAFIVGGVLR